MFTQKVDMDEKAHIKMRCPDQLSFSLSSTFGPFLALNGQPATIAQRNDPNVDDREKDKINCSNTTANSADDRSTSIAKTTDWTTPQSNG
jgi:hypothetical protein